MNVTAKEGEIYRTNTNRVKVISAEYIKEYRKKDACKQ